MRRRAALAKGDLLKVSVFTNAEAEEPVAALLERLFGQAPTVYSAENRAVIQVSVYCPSYAEWTPPRQQELRRSLQSLCAAGLLTRPARVTAKQLPYHDWAESWKRHFRPLEIGSALLIKPPWSRRRPRPGQAVVILEPGLGFGTGQHPTTAFCLEQLVACLVPGHERSFLDIGAGSGILALAAAKLGYRPVLAFDIDPVAVKVARQNARLNQVARLVRIQRQDLARLPLEGAERYDVICANLTGNVLVEHAARIINSLKANGILVLAGILTGQFPDVQSVYEQAGLRLLASRIEKEWQSATFVRA
jgi:ribosomal protein L11 methyltransferase